MDGVEAAEGYKPPPEFDSDSFEPLVHLKLDDSTELWLIQWPLHPPPDIDGDEVDLDLCRDGTLGSFDDSTGKTYHVISCESLKPDATVFLSSQWDSKIVGNISRRVSLVHYPEPEELEKRIAYNKKLMLQKSTGTLTPNSVTQFSTPTQGSQQRNSRSTSIRPPGTFSSKHRSTLPGVSEHLSKPSKRRHIQESSGSKG